jgi:hypothetical protein
MPGGGEVRSAMVRPEKRLKSGVTGAIVRIRVTPPQGVIPQFLRLAGFIFYFAYSFPPICGRMVKISLNIMKIVLNLEGH